MIAYKLYVFFVAFSVHRFAVAGTKRKHGLLHKKMHVGKLRESKSIKGFNFHTTQSIEDLIRNPSALNRDELSEINKLDSMNDMFMNPDVTSETQALSRQGLDPSVAMQISKIDNSLGDILGHKHPNPISTTSAKQKGEILPGYGEQYNQDGSVSLANNQWPEYQLKDTPPVSMRPQLGLNSMLLGNNGNHEPQAALNPNLLPGQKSDLGFGMGEGMNKSPIAPMMSGFVNDINGKPMNKELLNAPFEKPGLKNAGFRIPGEFSFKGERKSGDSDEEKNFVKNFMSSKKSHTERRKDATKLRH